MTWWICRVCSAKLKKKKYLTSGGGLAEEQPLPRNTMSRVSFKLIRGTLKVAVLGILGRHFTLSLGKYIEPILYVKSTP